MNFNWCERQRIKGLLTINFFFVVWDLQKFFSTKFDQNSMNVSAYLNTRQKIAGCCTINWFIYYKSLPEKIIRCTTRRKYNNIWINHLFVLVLAERNRRKKYNIITYFFVISNPLPVGIWLNVN